jgi:hypothetical protein
MKLWSWIVIEIYRPIPYCAECGGKCCKTYSGIFHPTQINSFSVESLNKLFAAGKHAIDWYNGETEEDEDEPGVYFIRPAHKGVSTLKDPSWGGECIFLTPTGCELAFEARPLGCKALKPSKDGCCNKTFYGKEAAAIDWLPFQDAINLFLTSKKE